MNPIELGMLQRHQQQHSIMVGKGVLMWANPTSRLSCNRPRSSLDVANASTMRALILMSALMVEALATSKEDLGRFHDRREVGADTERGTAG
eukprot:scaffold5364_cov134-Skeletonema_marinoi.AAC.6